MWISLPEGTAFADATGLCGRGPGLEPRHTYCKGRPRIPSGKCGDSDCLPVWPDDAIFSPEDLKEMESLYFYNKSSTRTADRAFCEGTGNDEATCENGGILTTGKCVEYMNEDECKAKAKEMFGDDMCKNTNSYGTDECDGVSTIGQATKDRPPGCFMFQNSLNNDMKVLSFNPAKPPDKSPVGEVASTKACNEGNSAYCVCKVDKCEVKEKSDKPPVEAPVSFTHLTLPTNREV